MLDNALLERALSTLGAVLEARGLRFELVVIGGSSMLLLGFSDRATRDIDVLAIPADGGYRTARPLPAQLDEAARDVGSALGLVGNWLNPGPTDLLQWGLPDGFAERTHERRYGGLTLHIADRFDLVCFKVYAGADQGPRSKHIGDLRKLDPSTDELLDAARWSQTHDPSPAYRQEVIGLLRFLGIDDAEERL